MTRRSSTSRVDRTYQIFASSSGTGSARTTPRPRPVSDASTRTCCGAEVAPTVRSNFADTAFWAGSITTDDQGKATVEFDLPESLTTWKLRAWSIGPGTRVGQGESQLITRKNLLVRLQAPRFFVQKD